MFFYCEGERRKVTIGEGGGDLVDGVIGLWRTPAAVAVTETRRTARILSGLTSEKQNEGQFYKNY